MQVLTPPSEACADGFQTDRIVYQLKAVYFALYSLDAVLCLLVVPFAYFWYEEGDEGAQEAGEQTVAGRLWSAAKYTLAFLVLVIILFVVGFFAPVAKKARDEHRDLDYFKHLLTENRMSPLIPPPLPPPYTSLTTNETAQTANARSPSASAS